jgi:hypothetical protein
MSLIEKLEPSIQNGSGDPLKLTMLPFDIPKDVMNLFNSANTILAGALLLLSALAQGSFAMILVVLGAIIAFIGHRVGLPIPDDVMGFKPSHLTGSAGVTLALFAITMLGSSGGSGRNVVDDDDD